MLFFFLAAPESLSGILSQKLPDSVRAGVSSIGVVVSSNAAATQTKQLSQDLSARFPQLKALNVYRSQDGASLLHAGNISSKGVVDVNRELLVGGARLQ